MTYAERQAQVEAVFKAPPEERGFARVFKYGTSEGAVKAWQVRHHGVKVGRNSYGVERVIEHPDQDRESRSGGLVPGAEHMHTTMLSANQDAAKLNITSSPSKPRPLHEIASEIKKLWGSKTHYGAKPYLEVMHSLTSIDDNYGADTGRSVVSYFLSNANSFKGPDAIRIKAELKAHLAKKEEGFADVFKAGTSEGAHKQYPPGYTTRSARYEERTKAKK